MSSEDNNGNRLPVDPTASFKGEVTRNFKVSDTLRDKNVTLLQKTGLDVSIMIQRSDEEKPTVILFKINKDGHSATLKGFQDVADRRHIDVSTQQTIIYELSINKDYLEGLRYREEDDPEFKEGIGIPVDVKDFFIDDNMPLQPGEPGSGSGSSSRTSTGTDDDIPSGGEIPPEQEIGQEAEYNNEGLQLMTVDQVLKLDKPQRIRVIGQVHVLRTRFDLIKEIYITCDNKKCDSKNKRQRYVLRRGLQSMGDLPYVFPGGPTACEQWMKCESCKKFRMATPGSDRFQTARKLELKHVDIISKSGNNDDIPKTTSSSTKSIDTLAVRVSGEHTDLQYSEEIEMVGELLIVPSGVDSVTRPTMQAGGIRRAQNNEEIVFAANMGKYKKLFYADKLKHTSRAKQIDFKPERDTIAIRKFAAIKPDEKKNGNMTMIDRLIAQFCPHIKGERLAKLAGLLQIAGASPMVRENWYDRTTVNLDFFGDVGTAKTEIGVHVTKVRIGSRIVLAQHSSARSIVAVAEKDPDGSWFVRPGPAILANKAILFIDELGAMRYWDDQDQFLQLMNTNNVPFNKAGIDTVLFSEVSFLLASNPTTLNWQLPNEIQTGELPAKRTILDRSDMIIIFKDPIVYDFVEVIDPNADIERNRVLRARAWADELDEAAGKHYNFDYVFLKKFFYYIHTSEQFKVVKFKNMELVHKLSDVWVDIKVKRPDLIGNRGVQSIRRIASCFARLMLKAEIDEEVVNETIKFVTEMYNRFGADVTDANTRERNITNDRDRMFYKVAENVKKFAEGHQWVMDTTNPNFGQETTDNTNNNNNTNAEVSFQSLIQKLCNDEINISNYFRLKLKGNQRTISCNTRFDELRKMFLEKCGFSGMKYEGGILKVVNDRAPRGLVLKWEKSTDVNTYGDSNGGDNNGDNQ